MKRTLHFMVDKLIMRSNERLRKTIFDKVLERLLNLKEASERLNLSYRQVRRSYKRYLQEGDSSLVHGSRGRPSSRRKPSDVKQRALELYQEKYWDYGPTLACEKMEEDGLTLLPETLRLWLKVSGLWQSRKVRKVHRKRRQRRSKFGELVQLDGSIHAWFVDQEEKQCLINMVDDATSKTLSLLAGGETTQGVFELLKKWIEQHGIPQGIYVDLKSLYVSPKSLRPKDEDNDDEDQEWLTHLSRACKELGIKVIKAYSPQAKGRVERSHGVYQDRFVKELRLKNIKSIEEANHILHSGFINKLNDKFMKAPACTEDAHIALRPDQDLNDILCWTYTRVVQNDGVVRFENKAYQTYKTRDCFVKARQSITVKKHLNGDVTLWTGQKKISAKYIEEYAGPKKEERQKSYYSSAQRSENARRNKHKSPWSRSNRWFAHTPHTIEMPF